MTLRALLTAAITILGTFTTAIAADPVVSNLIQAQRLGTQPTGTTCDVTATTLELTHPE